MIDLLCLLADKNMEAAVEAILARPQAMGLRPLTAKVLVHPRRDPGCYHEAAELLRPYRAIAGHAIVLLDHDWAGSPAQTGEDLEIMLEAKLERAGLSEWARAVVIDPELEVWVFSDSRHVERVLGFEGRTPSLRRALAERGLWNDADSKPGDPKGALEWALQATRQPRSSSIYRELGARVSLQKCSDRSFVRMRDLLVSWYQVAAP